ncbi:peptidase C2 [Mactra antiquata]
MGCGPSSEDAGRNNHRARTPPPKYPTPPPREPTPPPREPTPPPREPTPPPKEPTPPPREPTPPPREPTPPPREPTPPPREPTPPPREPTPPPREPTPPPPDVEMRGQGRQRRKDNDGYELNDSDVYESPIYDFRQHVEEMDLGFSEPPQSLPFDDVDFRSIAIEGEDVEWKRPGEFREAPVLFSDGTTRYDIGQGSAGTCWFLSMVAMLADRPKVFHRVVPKDAWNPEGGYFYCYFWRFGRWERVFIDDYLPIVHGTAQWGAKSAEDENEMWPSMLEKAFARFHGNYNAVYGGQSGDAFLAMTGGVSEYIDFDDALEADADSSRMSKALELHKRLKNACRHGESMLATEVPAKYDKHCGLVGGHAYSLTGADTVQSHDGKPVHLVRVRNPWGHTEWKGPWSDGSAEWDTVDSSNIPHANADDGEFYMSLQNFIKYFSGVTVCSMIPDFDQDGCKDSLNYCTTIFGEWFGDTAAGFHNRMNNPRYMFELPEDGADSDGLVPIVVQICQKLEHRKHNKFSIRVDLVKVLGQKGDNSGPICIMELLGDVTNVYKCERQMSVRYKVTPGTYAVIPSCMEPGREKEFIVRTYTTGPLSNVREAGREFAIMQAGQFCPPEDCGVTKQDVKYSRAFFGGWINGYNAGGQVSHSTFNSNPHLMFEVPGSSEQFVNITIMQEQCGENLAIGLRLFNYDDGYEVKEGDEHQSYLYQHYEGCPKTVDNCQGAFVKGSNADISHMLPPGRYFVLFHTDGANEQKRFSVIVRSTIELNPFPHKFD